MSKNQRSIKTKPSYGVLAISRLWMPDFPTPILATCLKGVLAPKRVDWLLFGWWHLLAFLDASSHLYKRVCPSVRPSIHLYVHLSICLSADNRRIFGRRSLWEKTQPPQLTPAPSPSSHTTAATTTPSAHRWGCIIGLLALLKLYMIHVKKSKINQEKAKLWCERELLFCAPPQEVWFSDSNFDLLSSKCHSSQMNS